LFGTFKFHCLQAWIFSHKLMCDKLQSTGIYCR
jgi:hypothetical protein